MSNAREISQLHPLQSNLGDLSPITSGIYTPTVAIVTNMDSVTAAPCFYTRIGNIVTVAGRVTADVTASGFAEFSMTLPISSDLATLNDVAGNFVMNSTAATANYGVVIPDTTNDLALFRMVASNLSSNTVVFNFTYLVI